MVRIRSIRSTPSVVFPSTSENECFRIFPLPRCLCLPDVSRVLPDAFTRLQMPSRCFANGLENNLLGLPSDPTSGPAQSPSGLTASQSGDTRPWPHSCNNTVIPHLGIANALQNTVIPLAYVWGRRRYNLLPPAPGVWCGDSD